MNAEELIQKHNTRNPYTIARQEEIIIMEEDLGEIYGYYHKLGGHRIIHVHEDLPEYFQRYLVAHLLYPAVNDLEAMQFVKRKKDYKYLQSELGANQFAIHLIVDPKEVDTLGLKQLMMKYKMDQEDMNDLKQRLSAVLGNVPDTTLEPLLTTVLNDFRNGEIKYGKDKHS